jgi:uncharacterized protein
MQIHIESLKNRPCKLQVDEPVEAFTELSELARKGLLNVDGSIHAELLAMQVNDLVEVEGTLSCSVVVPCSRCLRSVRQSLELPVTLVFTREGPAEVEMDEELELTEEAIGLIPFVGEVIDLRAALEQELLMGLPQHPLCADNCAGLCPVCGADRNQHHCNCAPPAFHAGFAALKGLKVTKE